MATSSSWMADSLPDSTDKIATNRMEKFKAFTLSAVSSLRRLSQVSLFSKVRIVDKWNEHLG